MYWILCGSYRVPDEPIKEKESSKPSYAVMSEHEGGQLIPCCYNHKGEKLSRKSCRELYMRAISWHFMSLYNPPPSFIFLILVSPPLPFYYSFPLCMIISYHFYLINTYASSTPQATKIYLKL